MPDEDADYEAEPPEDDDPTELPEEDPEVDPPELLLFLAALLTADTTLLIAKPKPLPGMKSAISCSSVFFV